MSPKNDPHIIECTLLQLLSIIKRLQSRYSIQTALKKVNPLIQIQSKLSAAFLHNAVIQHGKDDFYLVILVLYNKIKTSPHGNRPSFLQRIAKNGNLPLFVSYAQIAIAKVPATIRINPASAFLLNFSLNTK